MSNQRCIICNKAKKRPSKPHCKALKCQIEYIKRISKPVINQT